MIQPDFLLILPLLLVVTILVVVIWLKIAIYQFRLAVKANDTKGDLRRAIIIGLTFGGIYIVILIDLGFYLWLEAGDFSGAAVGLMLLCLLPFVQLIVAIGTLLQISYSRKMSQHISLVGEHFLAGKDDIHSTK